MSPLRLWVAALIAALMLGASAPASAEVLFQNSGRKEGWTSIGIQHRGRVDEVATPTYRGATALRMEQTFEGLSGYHSEVRLHEAQGPQGSDVYYGLALYLPPNWIYHPQNVTFQQWARGDRFGSPWVLMFVENDEIRVGGSGGVRGMIAKITGMQGTWVRVVTHIRHHPSQGLFEVWVNGVRAFSQTGAISPAAQAPIRWSVGMYCTRWRAEQPQGLNPMVLFHDQLRVATTYDEADPASWNDGTDGTGATTADAGGPPDRPPAPDAEEPSPVRPPTGEDARPPVAPADAGRPAAAEGTPVPGEVPAEGCGCRVGGRESAPGAAAAMALLLVAGWRMRARPRR
jgi:hypothetical protein